MMRFDMKSRWIQTKLSASIAQKPGQQRIIIHYAVRQITAITEL